MDGREVGGMVGAAVGLGEGMTVVGCDVGENEGSGLGLISGQHKQGVAIMKVACNLMRQQ